MTTKVVAKWAARAILVSLAAAIAVAIEIIFWRAGVWFVPPLIIGFVGLLGWAANNSGWMGS